MDKTDRETYFSEPQHRRWRYHHVDGGGKDCPAALLAFTAAWREKHLPPQSNAGLRVTYLDREGGGRRYQTAIHVFYEDTFEVMDEDWNHVEVDTLHCYMYRDHHCDCHRRADLEGQVATTGECAERHRFVIERVTAPGLPGLVLYSETMSADELERLLLGQEGPADAPEEAPAAATA
jgi:hypothetical protein